MENNVTITKKNMKYMDYLIFPVALFILPLLQCNIGVDVTDTGYSLGSFIYGGEQMGETWVKFATYLATVTGSFFARLPFGNTMLGMNLYTGMFVSLTAVLAYLFLTIVCKIPSWISFLGEFLAISLCWCPTVILYNYLTYFFFTVMIICLYIGIEKKNRVWLFAAGVLLGLDVMSRFPNITHGALILSLWYAGWLYKDKIGRILQDTMICIGGFVTGFGGILLYIMAKYGAVSYFEMIRSLFGGSGGGVEGHSLGDMVWSIIDAYLVGCKWFMFSLLIVLGGFVLFAVWKDRLVRTKKIVYVGMILVLFRFYYGRGMFNFRYYAYESMFQWTVIFLILSILVCLIQLIRKESSKRDKILASMILLVIMMTPLGSDNYLYPNINNLFLAAPVVVYLLLQYIVSDSRISKASAFPVKAMLVSVLLAVFVQSSAFGFTFVFRDGMSGEKRDTRITRNEVLRGMYTNRENAEALETLTAYCRENKITKENGKKALLYGDVPALSCFLELPSALSTTWADLASYTLPTMEKDIAVLESEQMRDRNTVIITSIGFAAWLEEDLQAMNMYGVDPAKYDKDEKALLIREYVKNMQYQEAYFNGKFVVFQ